MKEIQELMPLIENWANQKGILKPENAPKQYLKFLEEVGETAHEILHENWDKAKLEFGDIAVTAIIFAKQMGIYLTFKERLTLSDYFSFDWILSDISNDHIDKDFLIYLSDLCNFYNIDLKECLNLAWDKIKDRTGKTENGTFIKDKP